MSGLEAISHLFRARADWTVVLPCLALLLAAIFSRNLSISNTISYIPQIGQELGSDEKRRQVFLSNARALYSDGYQKFKNGIFRIVTSKETSVVVVAPRYLAELKKLPDHVLSMDEAVAQTMQSKYTGLIIGNNSIPHTIKTSLTPALPRLSGCLSDEVRQSFLDELPDCDDWTPVNINRKLLRIVARVSGRIFVGPELCHDERYLDAAINYTVDLMNARRAIDALEPWKRPFLARRLPQVKRLEQRFKEATAILHPVVEARQKLAPEKKPDDMLQWMMDDTPAMSHRQSSMKLAQLQLFLSFAAIHTTTMSATNAFYNLAAYPEIHAELRQEIISVLESNNGAMSTHALQAMKKVDSFLKETIRFHPPGASSFQRKVLQPFQLSSGERIPVGVIIEVPAHAIAHDPEVFPDPERFDALRFYNLRQKSREDGEVEVAARHQFVSVSQNSLSFGYGRHACPGRFFAANEIKMIVAMALLMYDIRLAGGATERYRNLDFGASSIPDPTKELLFKRVIA